MDKIPRPQARIALLSLLSGLLLFFSFPNLLVPRIAWFQPWLAWVALLPLFEALRGASRRQAVLAGFACGWVFFGGLTYWVVLSWDVGLPAWVTWAGLASYGALYLAAFSFLAVHLLRRGFAAPALWLPALWCLLEFAREHLLTGTTGYSLGSSQAMNPVLRPLASVTGMAGLHFSVVLGNWLIFKTWRKEGWGRAERGSAGLVLLLLAAALLTRPGKDSQGPELALALIQGGTRETRVLDDPAADPAMLEYARLTVEAGLEGAQLALWPEGIFHFGLTRDPWAEAIRDFADRHAMDLLVGASQGTQQTGLYTNSAAFLSPGKAPQLYHKRHLVPFSEYTPMRLPSFFDPEGSGVDYVPGDKAGTGAFLSAGVPIVPVICYESIFGGELARRERGVLVVIAENTWFGGTGVPAYHLMHSMLRAVEGQRDVAHVSGSGPSAIINFKGEIVLQIPAGAKDFRIAKVGQVGGSVYQRLGDWFVGLCLLLLAACILNGSRAQRGA